MVKKAYPVLLGLNASLLLMGIVYSHYAYLGIAIVSSLFSYLLWVQDRKYQEKIDSLCEMIDSNHRLFDGWKTTVQKTVDDYHLLLSFITENTQKYPLIEEEFNMYRQSKLFGPVAKA